MNRVLDEMVPSDVSCSEGHDEADDWHDLFPLEQQLMATASAGRRLEFAAGRRVAREALVRLGVPRVAISRDNRGVPGWPANVVGSITHCPGYRAAVVARTDNVTGLGVDAEPNEPLPSELMHVVCSAEEIRAVHHLQKSDASVAWDRLIFSAKESVFKAWYPSTRTWLGHLDVSVRPTREGTFSAYVAKAVEGRAVKPFEGAWTVVANRVHTLVVTR